MNEKYWIVNGLNLKIGQFYIGNVVTKAFVAVFRESYNNKICSFTFIIWGILELKNIYLMQLKQSSNEVLYDRDINCSVIVLDPQLRLNQQPWSIDI